MGLWAEFKLWNISDASLGTEELAHLEIVATIVHQLTRNLTPDEIMQHGFQNYYVDHTTGVWPQAAGGVPFNSCEFQCKGDPITDLYEDMAAEQKARSTYENILRLVKDPEVADPIRYLRQREIVHFQRFGETLRALQEDLNSKNFYAFNASFDCPAMPCNTTSRISNTTCANMTRMRTNNTTSSCNCGTSNRMRTNNNTSCNCDDRTRVRNNNMQTNRQNDSDCGCSTVTARRNNDSGCGCKY